MYFSSRMQAGRMLAGMMVPKYRYENCAVVALDDGGVMVGAQIAIQLHCFLTMMIMRSINLPREPKAIAGVGSNGDFTYNKDYSQGELDEFVGEYREFIEEKKYQTFQEINRLLGSGELNPERMLKHRQVILASDGLTDTMKLDMAMEMLKPIEIQQIIVATPFASVPVIDKIHIIADAIYCLDVIEEPLETDHYYDQNDVPDHQKIVDTIENIVYRWI